MPHWLRYAFWLALGLSLLLHLAALIAQPLYAWLTRPEFAETELRKVSKTLQAQRLADAEPGKPEALRGVKPAEQLEVRFGGSPVPVKITAVARPESKVARTAASRVRAMTEPVPLATASAPAIAVATSSQASAAVTASMVALASAPRATPVPASTPVRTRASTVLAASTEQMGRFPRDVRVTYVWGSVPARMHWQIGQSSYRLDVEGSLGFKSRTFHSEGEITAQGIVPRQFSEYRDNKPEPKYQVDFDWQAMKVQIGEPGQRKEEALQEGDQDLFSAAFHLALVGGRAQTMSLYTGRKRYPDIHFEPAGEATLTIGRQHIDAVLLRGRWQDRRVDFWLAPQWNNLPVRMTVDIPKEGSFDLWANIIELDGQRVLDGPRPGAAVDSNMRRP
ncbi:DUF3108 domain-containing protein [Chitinilyticum piscinae]|uniref:DUF3108 domain-containing protein n=1 Tax=Chitinilyticum piscinae TaxID=2866724 RepID=A0A8J7KGN4_9NEIS|nr:DUF3108 domain-containing protein [Chitinilyticum piscinae]MBE9610554.1 DUF3108 domain-containing protein [Chitinilyticum piscinae]